MRMKRNGESERGQELEQGWDRGGGAEARKAGEDRAQHQSGQQQLKSDTRLEGCRRRATLRWGLDFHVPFHKVDLA